jgi:hypothetical protein
MRSAQTHSAFCSCSSFTRAANFIASCVDAVHCAATTVTRHSPVRGSCALAPAAYALLQMSEVLRVPINEALLLRRGHGRGERTPSASREGHSAGHAESPDRALW